MTMTPPLGSLFFAAAIVVTVVAAAVWRTRAPWIRPGMSDRLTGLANRKMFESRVAHAQLRARRHQFWVSVLTIDVDELATVNNTMGRECGDQLLRDIAKRLGSLARIEDTVARLSSDEFAILLEQIDSPTGAARAARRILDEFQKPLTIDGRAVVTSLSIGISVDRGGANPSESLMREAGIALGRAKARGKGRFETFEPQMGVEAVARLTLEAELQQAVERDELLIHYQPIVELASGVTVGAEALVRWEHPDRGLLYPADFISMAETGGAIVPLGRYVLQAACRAAFTFGCIGAADQGFGISVNVSSRQFGDGDGLVADVRDALHESGLRPELLTVEITESSLLEDLDGAAEVAQRLRGMRVNVALDDFGTGYSSLTYMKKIPVSGLKIDASFVRDLDDPATAAIVKAILEIASELDISVTAEGAETHAQVRRLRSLGCRLVQGHYYGSAIPEAAFLRLMMRQLSQQRAAEPVQLEAMSQRPPSAAAG